MAWSNPFRRSTPQTVRSWDYSFELTDEHPNEESMQPLKFTYDKMGEACLNRLDEISPPASGILPRANNQQWTQDVKKDEQKAPRDLYLLLKEHATTDPLLKPLWNQVNTVPDWVDWEQIARGQDVFYRYGGANITGLTYQSLLGGMGAARVVETLARTGGFNTKVARRRLYETTQHILEVTKSIDSIRPGGDGWASTIRVRLLHSAVRNRIMKLAQSRPSYYDVEKFGVPINDLDSIGTICTFSSSLVWFSLPRQGVFLRKQEADDYIALWRYVAYLIGCPEEPFATFDSSRRWLESLLYFEIDPSEMSGILANNLIKCLEARPPTYTSRHMLVASARWLNGHTLCDKLGLERPPIYYTFLMAGQCIFYMTFAYLQRLLPGLDQRKISFLRRAFWVLIVEAKSGLEGQKTTFDFQYVPEYETLTLLQESGEEAQHNHVVERRNLKYLMLGLSSALVGAVASIKVTSYLFSKLIN